MANKNNNQVQSKQKILANKNQFLIIGIMAAAVLVISAFAVTALSSNGLTSAQKDGSRVFGTYCTNCHIANGQGNARGIDLSNVGSRRNAYWLKIWINDPKSISKKATMQGFKLGDAETKNLIDYLSSLK